NHLCYPGYWIWFIPLRHGVTSVGVVADASQWDMKYHKPEGMIAHLKTHRAAAELLEPAELMDHGAFSQLAFRTKQFFSGNRWATVGDAAAFVVPSYSPGYDFIAIENDMVAEMIAREVAGEDIRERVALSDEFMQFRFEAAMLLYSNQYSMFGSYDLLQAKVFFDCACYYNLWFDSYLRDEHLDLKAMSGMLRRGEPVLATMRNFRDLFQKAGAILTERGTYHQNNRGVGMHDADRGFGPLRNVGHSRRRPEIDQRTGEIFNQTARLVQGVLDGGRPYVERPFFEFAEPGALSCLLEGQAPKEVPETTPTALA